MGWNVRRSRKIAPGIRLNLSSKGLGMSFGPKHSKISISPTKRITSNIGIPGTGIRYTSVLNTKKSRSARAVNNASDKSLDYSEYQRPEKPRKTVRGKFPASSIILAILSFSSFGAIFTNPDTSAANTVSSSDAAGVKMANFIIALVLAALAFWRFQKRKKSNEFWREREAESGPTSHIIT